ncbi:MAG: PD40 domain-containing protein [Deltaproteobacteria bacterium]|nr:PD40 domain-containing protein [Deltaproteobacteria bacterium]
MPASSRPPLRGISALLSLPLVFAAFFSVGAPAQQGPTERVRIVVTPPGEQKVVLGLPKPIGGAGAATEFYDVLRRDLELSGYVTLLDPAAQVEPAGTGIRPGQFRFEDWSVLGAPALAKTLLQSRDGGELYAEVWTYDVNGRARLGARSFSAKGEDARLVAHKVASEIILRLTGKAGPFNTRFAVSGNFSGNKEIYTVDFDGYRLTPVTRTGSINIQPAWSPDARRIAYTGYAAGNPDLYVADLSGGKITRLSARSGINTGAAWHPKGGLLALTLSVGGDSDIFTIDASTGRQLARLTDAVGIDVSPAFSPDGSKVAFVSERGGSPQIYVANADGSNARRVTFSGNYNQDPVWHPDGDKLAFVGREGNFDIFVVNVDGSGLTRLTQGKGDNEDPSWAPDGNYVAFSSNRTGANHIWMSTLDGAHQVQLTRGKGGYTNPDWSPTLPW